MAAGTKLYRKFKCKTQGCNYEYEAAMPAYEVTHFCPKKRQHIALAGVEEA